VARQVVVEIIGNDKQFTKTFDGATKSSSSFGQKFKAVGKAVAVGGALIGGGMLVVGT
jgi:hypothetical protein